MRKPLVILALLAAPALVAAQSSASAEAETRAQADVTVKRGNAPRIPDGFSAETRARLETMVETARQKDLPAEPMTDRAAEGQAKGASERAILAEAAATLVRLELSQSALIRAGQEHPEAQDVARGAELIARGTSTAQLTALARGESGEHRLEVALEVLTDLQARGLPVDRALTAIVNAPASVSASTVLGVRIGTGRKP